MLFPLYDLNPHQRFPWIAVLIIAINIAITAWSTSLPEDDENKTALRYGFVPARLTFMGKGQPVLAPMFQEDRRFGMVQVREVKLSTAPKSVYPTFFTTMFLHGGWPHVLLNMWFLWVFGNNIEDRLGHLMFLSFYLIGGIVATLCHWMMNPESKIAVVGASGAVAAVLGGYAITFPTAKVRTLVIIVLIMIVDLPALVFLGIWFVLQLASGLLMQQGAPMEPVAFWAHIGGFVAGMILMPLLSLGSSPPGRNWRQETEDLFRFDDPRTINQN